MTTTDTHFTQSTTEAHAPISGANNDEPHIIIIGAGVSGLALAQGLLRNSISFTVHERDETLNPRLQGYSLKISEDMAEKLRSMLTPAAWSRVEKTSIETGRGETNVDAIDGRVTACRKTRLPRGNGQGKPYTIDRGLMRQAMMEEIESKVKYGSEFVRYEVVGAGKSSSAEQDEAASPARIRAFFADGSHEEGTLLVGADGPTSAVRKQFLPDWKASQTGTCCIYGKSPLRAELQKRFPLELRRWITVVTDRPPIIEGIAKGLQTVTMVLEFCHFDAQKRYEIPEDYVHWGLMFHADMLAMDKDQLAEKLKKDAPGLAMDITAEWHPSVRSLIELQEESVTVGLKIYSMPSSIRDWQSSAYVTVLGDAVHVMSPLGGVGAVAALQDSYGLLQTIVNEGVSTTSIRSFEKKMRASAEAFLIRTDVAGARMLDLPQPQMS